MVEDEELLATAVANELRLNGFGVIVAPDGDSGYVLAKRHDVDLIMLDIMLPGINGVEVCRRLRAEGRWTPILVLTAGQGELDEAKLLDAGADDYLHKPFSLAVLVARCRALLRRGPADRPPLLRAGDLILDVGTRTVHRGEEAIELTRREFALLECLMRRAGDVCSKAELLAEVWGPTRRQDPNLVEVYMGYLRRKIDEPFGTSTLSTVRGQGYRLGAPA